MRACSLVRTALRESNTSNVNSDSKQGREVMERHVLIAVVLNLLMLFQVFQGEGYNECLASLRAKFQ